MSYRAELQSVLRFVRCIDEITEKAKSLEVTLDAADLYMVLILEFSQYIRSPKLKREFFRKLQYWAEHQANSAD